MITSNQHINTFAVYEDAERSNQPLETRADPCHHIIRCHPPPWPCPGPIFCLWLQIRWDGLRQRRSICGRGRGLWGLQATPRDDQNNTLRFLIPLFPIPIPARYPIWLTPWAERRGYWRTWLGKKLWTIWALVAFKARDRYRDGVEVLSKKYQRVGRSVGYI